MFAAGVNVNLEIAVELSVNDPSWKTVKLARTKLALVEVISLLLSSSLLELVIKPKLPCAST